MWRIEENTRTTMVYVDGGNIIEVADQSDAFYLSFVESHALSLV